MRGISVFLNEDLSEQTITYIKNAQAAGFQGIFTSLHIPEDDASRYAERLFQLGQLAKSLAMKLMVDVSADALQRAGFSFENTQALLEIGVTGLRMDYGIDNQVIADLTHRLDIGLNASTITAKDIEELREHQADFTRFEAWHNYYPRPETGLDRKWFIEKNAWLKENGFRIFAFVPGDEKLRGPLMLGLPTIEEHRGKHSLYCAEDLVTCGVDAAYIGDPEISTSTLEQWQSYQKGKVLLHITVDSDVKDLILGKHTNRLDDARDVIRSAEARFKERRQILPKPLQNRRTGAVTIDNEKYGRYMGEIQIIKHQLIPDEKVNVVGQVVEKDLALIRLIKAGTPFELQEEAT